jgi:hypothetical protein
MCGTRQSHEIASLRPEHHAVQGSIRNDTTTEPMFVVVEARIEVRLLRIDNLSCLIFLSMKMILENLLDKDFRSAMISSEYFTSHKSAM